MSSLLCPQVSLRSQWQCNVPVDWLCSQSLLRVLQPLQKHVSIAAIWLHYYYSLQSFNCWLLLSFLLGLASWIVFFLGVYFHWIVKLTQTERLWGRNRRMWKTIKGWCKKRLQNWDIPLHHDSVPLLWQQPNTQLALPCDQQYVKTGRHNQERVCVRNIYKYWN